MVFKLGYGYKLDGIWHVCYRLKDEAIYLVDSNYNESIINIEDYDKVQEVKENDTLKIYLLTQNSTRGYDTYDSVICVSNSKMLASYIHPHGVFLYDRTGWFRDDWARNNKEVHVEYLGDLKNNSYKNGTVLLASFNPG